MKIKDLSDAQLVTLIDNRWKSSETVWDAVNKTYPVNLRYYKSNPEWLETLPRKQPRVRTNRIFVNTEAVINSLIANPPVPNILPNRDTPEARDLAQAQERYFLQRYAILNVKETLRKGLRNLYFGRLIVLKPFWDSKLNDFNVRALDPRKVRVQKNATKEEDSEFAIEEVEDALLSVMRRFPNKKADVMAQAGYNDETLVLINNPDIIYKEAWVRDYVIFKYGNIILDKMPNPYWDWDGILLTQDEESQLSNAEGDSRRNILATAKLAQPQRKMQQVQQLAAAQAPADPNAPQAPQAQAPTVPGMPPGLPQMSPQSAPPAGMQAGPPPTGLAADAAHAAAQTGQSGDTGTVPLEEYQDTAQTFNAYYFNHFDHPRKPYIFATAFNNENTPIGQTDMITQAIPLQIDADETKRNITRNSRFVNGVWKIDAGVMGKSDAQRLDTEVGGIVWGKGVKDGALRETGQPLPAFVFDNYRDDLAEIDNIMAASSAFKGEREGAETKAGRLALIDQSYLRLNELVQIVDYVNYDLFNWFYQLAKVRYTEHHYAKTLGKDEAVEILTLIQDDFMDGAEVRVIGGKTLPEDREFKYEQAQQDVAAGLISPIRYLEIAGYDSPQSTAKDALMFKLDPYDSVGITPEERQKIPPPVPATQLRETVSFQDLPAAAKPQFLARMGIQIQPQDAQDIEDAPITIAFKDLPPDGQIQAAAKAGIQLNPEVLVAKSIAEHKQNNPPPPAPVAPAKPK